MKDASNALTFAGQEAVQGRAVLHFLIGTPRGPDQIAGVIKKLRLPDQTDEANIGAASPPTSANSAPAG